MNQIIPKTVNFKELIENSNTTLSLTVQSKLVEHLNQEFTEEQQQWYIANLYVYMHYHPTNDYPINLEHVFRIIGFAHKKNAKRTLENNFTINDDYKIRVLPKEQSSWGGSGGEEIMLNIDTFKNLCMMAKTDKGKEIRKYYVKLENIYNHIIKEELEQNSQLLADKEKQLTDKEKELERTKKELEKTSKLKVKQWYDSEPGHTVYGFISNEAESNSLITIGRSKNIKRRESDYMTHNQHGRMFYMRKCYNCDLAEKVLHHVLGKYRCKNNREWFEISEDLATYVIDLVCDFLDRFVGCSEKLPDYKLKEFIDGLNIKHFDHKVTLEDVPIKIPEIIVNNNIKDYDKFLSDCCIMGGEYYALPCELIAAYRIWCKGDMTSELRNEFCKHMKDKFEKRHMYFENSGTRSTVLIGLKPKDIVMELDEPKLKEFCVTNCQINYSYKMLFSEFMQNYKNWLQVTYPGVYAMSEEDVIKQLNKQFLVCNYAVWGMQLKSLPLPGITTRRYRNANIHHINFDTKETFAVYKSLAEASEKLSIDMRTICSYILRKRPLTINNVRTLLVYEKPDRDIVGHKRNMKYKLIHKFIVDTPQFIESYKTLKEAADKNRISQKTLIRYISKEQCSQSNVDSDATVFFSYKDSITEEDWKNITNKQQEISKSGCVKIRPCKTIQKIDFETNEVLETFYGILDAAAKLKIGECTVSRHLKSGKKIKMKDTMTFVVLKYVH